MQQLQLHVRLVRVTSSAVVQKLKLTNLKQTLHHALVTVCYPA